MPTYIKDGNNAGQTVLNLSDLASTIASPPSGTPTNALVIQALTDSGSLASPAADGVDATGQTPLTGGVGIRGWLSTIAYRLANLVASVNFGGVVPAFSAATQAMIVSGTTPTLNIESLGTITSTGNLQSSSIYGPIIECTVRITTATGTNKTLDLSIQTSDNNGTTWTTIYQFPRITAVGIFRTPPIYVGANLRRWNWVVGGTSPSFITSAGNSEGQLAPGIIFRQGIDNALDLTTLGATSTPIDLSPCRNWQAEVYASGGTLGSVQLQFSGDGVSYFSIGSSVSLSSGGVTFLIPPAGTLCRFARVIVTAVSSGTTYQGTRISGL